VSLTSAKRPRSGGWLTGRARGGRKSENGREVLRISADRHGHTERASTATHSVALSPTTYGGSSCSIS
jgi:hypothetical protein